MQDIDTERQEMVNDPKLRSLILPDYPMDWLDFYFCDSFGTPLDYEDIIERLEQGKNLIRFGYRGCAKTSIIRKMICKWIATKKKSFFRRTSYDIQKAEENITSISNMLIGSDTSVFNSDYGRLYYNEQNSFSIFKQKEQKRTSGFNTTNGIIVKANSIKKSTRGLNIFLRDKSMRPDCDILDDIDTDENTENPKTITKTYNKVKLAIFGGSTGQKIILGNTINEDGVLPRLAEDYKDNKKRKIVYTRFIENGKLHRPERFVMDEATADRINAGIINEEEKVQSLEGIRKEQGRDFFGANYLLEPLRNDVQIIEEQWIRYEQYQHINFGDLTYISVDSAESDKDGTDPIGITIGTKIRETGKRNLRHSEELKGRQKDLGRIGERLAWLYKEYKANGMVIENKAGGITLRKFLIMKYPRMQIFLYDPGKMSKIGRLRQCQPYIEGGRVVFSPDIDQAFIKQLIKFPNVQFDDRTDSMTALILKFIYQLRQAERQNIKSPDQKSVELPNKNDIPTEKKSISKAQELIDKYKGESISFTKDF